MSITPQRLAELVAERLDYDRLADAIAVRLERPAGEWLTARQLEARYGHSAKWWRQHKVEFGARQVGDGPRPRWEFDSAHVKRVLSERRIA